jgi:hypothetical protein
MMSLCLCVNRFLRQGKRRLWVVVDSCLWQARQTNASIFPEGPSCGTQDEGRPPQCPYALSQPRPKHRLPPIPAEPTRNDFNRLRGQHFTPADQIRMTLTPA